METIVLILLGKNHTLAPFGPFTTKRYSYDPLSGSLAFPTYCVTFALLSCRSLRVVIVDDDAK